MDTKQELDGQKKEEENTKGIYEITLEMTMEKKKNVFSTRTTDVNLEIYAETALRKLWFKNVHLLHMQGNF